MRSLPLIGDVQEVGVHTEGWLPPLAGRHRNVVLLCIGYQL